MARFREWRWICWVAPGNWPNLVVEDEQCILPVNLGWSYSGGGCTGTPVTTATNAVAPATAGIGEGYYGFKPAVAPNGNEATIALNLKLIQVSPASPATQAAGN